MLRCQQEEQWWPLAAFCSYPAPHVWCAAPFQLQVACMLSGQLSLGSAHVLASAALCVSSACLQTS